MRTLKEISEIVEAYAKAQEALGDATFGKAVGFSFAIGSLEFRLTLAIHDQTPEAVEKSLSELRHYTDESLRTAAAVSAKTPKEPTQ